MSSTYSRALSSRVVDDSAVITHSFGTLAHQEIYFETRHCFPQEVTSFPTWQDYTCKNYPKELVVEVNQKLKVEETITWDYLEGCVPKIGAVFFPWALSGVWSSEH